jgi:ABC-type sugar transport system ATPase subunit
MQRQSDMLQGVANFPKTFLLCYIILSVLKVSKLNKSYGSKLVLDEIDLEISDSEFLVLVGPSGCGKSTLMRILAGLEKDFSGTINYKNKDLTTLSPKERNLSMVFQNYALYPHKSVFDNIAFPLKLKGLAKKFIEERVCDIAAKLSLSELLMRKPSELSGGQRQRVALARALIKNPDIFLMDEPLSNLDAKLRVQLRQEIFKLKSMSKAMFIYVTHDQVEALTLGDRIAVLNDGKIQQVASPIELFDKPANTFVASFIGSPAMNLIKGYKDGVILGFRPDPVSLVQESQSDLKFSGSIVNIENLGNEIIIYLNLDNYICEGAISMKLKTTAKVQGLFETYQQQKANSEKLINIEFFVAESLLYYFSELNNKLLYKGFSNESN